MIGTMVEPWVPLEVSDVLLAFPGNVEAYYPPFEMLAPKVDELRQWTKLFGRIFFIGKDPAFVPKPGIDRNMAIRHLRAVMSTRSSKHEHKELAAAFLMREWFHDALCQKSWEESKSLVSLVFAEPRVRLDEKGNLVVVDRPGAK